MKNSNTNYPLISVLVACYNNQKFIYETLKSIFEQTYPNIEVLIGDDASSDFDGETLINWINRNRTPNIKKIAIFQNEFNVGTVKNLRRLQLASQGDYLFNIAADDILYNKYVFENFYKYINNANETVDVLVAETELWDHELKHKIGNFITPEIEKTIKGSTNRELFVISANKVIFPASYLYSRSVLSLVGDLTEHYKLVEDCPSHLRLLIQDIKFHYMDISPSIKHRDGGISHGNSLHSKEVFLHYYNDLINLYHLEILPHIDIFTDDEKKQVQALYGDRIRAYYKIHIPDYHTLSEQNNNHQIMSLREKLAQNVKRMLYHLAENVAKKRTAVLLFVISILMFSLCGLLYLFTDTKFFEVLFYIFLTSGIIIFVILTVLVMFKIYWLIKKYKKIHK